MEINQPKWGFLEILAMELPQVIQVTVFVVAGFGWQKTCLMSLRCETGDLLYGRGGVKQHFKYHKTAPYLTPGGYSNRLFLPAAERS